MQKQFLNKDTLKQFISDNRLNEVVNNLIFQLNEFLDKNKGDIDYEPIRKLSDALIINSGKLNGLEHDKIIGILDRETQRITTAEVQNAVLYILDKLPQQFWNYEKSTNEFSFKTKLIEGIELLHKQQNQFEHDIFICFSSKDKDIVRPIWEKLRGYGLRVFLSDEDLKQTVGFNFLDKIDYAIKHCQHMLLIASQNSMNSTYVRDEYQAFYSENYVKDPNKRLLFIYNISNYSISDLPSILRTKQIATSIEQIVQTLVTGEKKQTQNGNITLKSKKLINNIKNIKIKLITFFVTYFVSLSLIPIGYYLTVYKYYFGTESMDYSRPYSDLGGFLILFGIAIFITSIVFSLIILYKTWKSLSHSINKDISAGKAVGFLLIPFFNFYWVFVALRKLFILIFKQTNDDDTSVEFITIFCIIAVIPIIDLFCFILFPIVVTKVANNAIKLLQLNSLTNN